MSTIEELTRTLLEEIKLEEDDQDRDLALAEHELDEKAVRQLADTLTVHGLVRVRVTTCATDVHYSPIAHELWSEPGERPFCQDRTCRYRRGGCDLDREGVVRDLPAQSLSGRWSVYVDEMTPGDDKNPSRYLSPRHVTILS